MFSQPKIIFFLVTQLWYILDQIRFAQKDSA